MAFNVHEADRSDITQMKEFPCIFNLRFQQDIGLCKLKSLKKKLVEELQYEGDEDGEEEHIRKKNFLTWIYFRLDKLEKATSLNTKVVKLTEEQNMTALGNRVFLCWHDGNVFEGQEYLSKLKSMKSGPNFDIVLATAKAEQAYCHSRLGGGFHCGMAITLFKEALNYHPDKALWEYGLGLMYRRMTNANLNLSSPGKESINEYTKMAAECLFKVTDNKNADKNVQSLAFAQLTSLRQVYPHRFYPQYDHIFRDQGLHQLCEKALENGSTIPSVLTSCGKSFKNIDVDRAISLLEKSVEIRDVNPIAYHHLGLSYIKKVDLKSKFKYVNRITDDSGRNKCRRQLFKSTEREFSVQERQSTHFHKDENSAAGHLKEVCKTKKIYRSQSHQEQRQQAQHPEFNRSSSEDPRMNLTWLNTYINSPDKHGPLSKEDDLVQKAIHALEKSLSSSNGCNLPALLNLGQILRRTGQLFEAVKKFLKLVNSSEAVHFHKITVINALQEAGLCYFQLSETALGEEKQNYKEEGKKYLTKALTYAVELAKSKPELKGWENDVWIAFRKLSTRLENEERSPATAKQKIQLLVMAEKYEKVLPVIEELLSLDEEEINNEDTIKHRLTAYLKVKQYEEALTFMNILELKEAVRTSDSWIKGEVFDLRMKIVLAALYERLRTDTDSLPLFQQLFKMTFGHCAGISDTQSENVPDSGSEFSPKRDILFCFDEDELSDPSKGHATRFGRCLKHTLSAQCGLDTEENLRGNFDFIPIQTEMDIQLTEMLKYQVVVVVLDDEDRSGEFEAMLHRIPCLSGPTCPHFCVLDIEGSNSPNTLPFLKPYKWMKMEDIGQLNVTSPGARCGAGVDTEDKPVQDVFQGDIDAVMRLFCFIIGKEWPHT